MVGFVNEGNTSYAGKHLLVDLYDCAHNASMDEIERAMVTACEATGATVLFHHAHPFDGDGSSGAVILAESHGTWHQWPEHNFIAIDIFVCGTCDPHKAIPVLVDCFRPGKTKINMRRRGRMPLD